MNLETIRADPILTQYIQSNLPTAPALNVSGESLLATTTVAPTTVQAPTAANAEYNSYQSLATVAPVPTVKPFTIQPLTPYTSQFSNGTASGAIAAPSATNSIPVVPSAAQSPASQASTTNATTTAAPTTDSLIANVLSSLSSGGNVSASGSGAGVGQYSTSLPSPTTADVEALQPTAVTTSSSGPNIALIIGIIVIAGLGVYLYYQHKKGQS